LAKYEETVEKDRRFELEDDSQPMYPKYPIISRPRSVVEQNYVSSNMIPQEEEQHLPVSQNIPVRYNRPLVKTTPLNTYPIVEHLEPQLSCTDVANHIKNCPICKQLYIERVFVIMVIAVLIIIIIALIFKIRSSK
jgi:hypothetical protein